MSVGNCLRNPEHVCRYSNITIIKVIPPLQMLIISIWSISFRRQHCAFIQKLVFSALTIKNYWNTICNLPPIGYWVAQYFKDEPHVVSRSRRGRDTDLGDNFTYCRWYHKYNWELAITLNDIGNFNELTLKGWNVFAVIDIITRYALYR